MTSVLKSSRSATTGTPFFLNHAMECPQHRRHECAGSNDSQEIDQRCAFPGFRGPSIEFGPNPQSCSGLLLIAGGHCFHHIFDDLNVGGDFAVKIGQQITLHRVSQLEEAGDRNGALV